MHFKSENNSMPKGFTYCFEPNKIRLRGFLERATLEALLFRQKDALSWNGTWNGEQAWERLAQWIQMLLKATTHQPIIPMEESDEEPQPHVDRANIDSERFEIDIEELQGADAVGWAALIHLLNYVSEFKSGVYLTGVLSHHRAFIRLYQLESFLAPYLSEVEVTVVRQEVSGSEEPEPTF